LTKDNPWGSGGGVMNTPVFEDYFALSGEDFDALAARVGVTSVQLRRIAAGEREASMPTARAIERETRGFLTVQKIAAIRGAQQGAKTLKEEPCG
jgi:DNA-binding transcriptional regulator YdaS (Cro superfamily)